MKSTENLTYSKKDLEQLFTVDLFLFNRLLFNFQATDVIVLDFSCTAYWPERCAFLNEQHDNISIVAFLGERYSRVLDRIRSFHVCPNVDQLLYHFVIPV